MPCSRTILRGYGHPRIDITERNGYLSRRYQQAGVDRPWPEEQRWLAEALARVVRDNGYDAASRVKAILARGGVNSVLGEVQLSRTDPGKRKLLIALVHQVALTSRERDQVVRLANRFRSKSDREAVLASFAR